MNKKRLLAAMGVTAGLLVLAGTTAAAPASRERSPIVRNVPMVQDWSTRMATYRNPETPEEARAKGRLAQWQRRAADPRFMMAMLHRLEADADRSDARLAAAKSGSNVSRRMAKPSPPPPPPALETTHRDWSNVLGGGTNGNGGSGAAGVYPAKYSFNINAAPSCTNDFIVYPTQATGTDSSGTSETWVGSFAGNATAGQTVVLGTAPRTVTLTASTTSNTGMNFLANTGNNTTNASNLAAAVNRWSGQTGFSATSAGVQVTISLNTTGNVTQTVTEGLTNFGALVNTNGSGSPGQPSLIAFNQLYNTTCSTGTGRLNDNAPNVHWAYNTGGTVRTSPVLSYFDGGKQVAFVQSNGGQAEFVLLKWKAGEGTAAAPFTPASTTVPSDYRNGTGNCAGGVSCMIRISFSGSTDVTHSSPFIDYFSNTAYVGADNGTLHKFTGVFAGSPAEVTTGGFPATVSSGRALSPPVIDFSGSAFVGSASAVGSGGALHRVNTSDGTVVSSGKLTADSANPGVRASPLLDVSEGRLYVFIFNDGGAAGTNCSAAPCRAVIEFDTAFAAASTGNKVLIGSGNSTTRTQFNGAFDNAWYTSVDSSGSMYVCGGAPGNTGQSVMWKVPITTGTIGIAAQGATVSGTLSGNCSPVSQIKNGNNEYLFYSLTADGDDGDLVTNGCTGACVYMLNLADLNGSLADVQETWDWDVANGGGNVGINTTNETFQVNGVIFTTANNSTGLNVDISGNRATDCANIAAKITANVTGYTAACNSPRITITRTAPGDVDDNLVTEAVTNLSFAGGFIGAGGTVWATTNDPAAGLAAPNGTSAIIIDNISNATGASQVYYSTLGTTGNAIQASQAGLQ